MTVLFEYSGSLACYIGDWEDDRTESVFFDVNFIVSRVGSRISGKGVHMYKRGRGFALLILSHFL